MHSIPNNSISKLKWAKRPDQRSPSQTVGHLIITFKDPDAANEAILKGLVICNKKVQVSKCRREPVRCLKCQAYNHVAHECILQREICARCGENHRTNTCSSTITKCTPCNEYGHTSSDRACPTLQRKCRDYETNHPENALPFFPSKESWTWEASPPQPQPSAESIRNQQCPHPHSQRNTTLTGYRQTQLPFQPTRKTAPNGRELERRSWDRPPASQPPPPPSATSTRPTFSPPSRESSHPPHNNNHGSQPTQTGSENPTNTPAANE